MSSLKILIPLLGQGNVLEVSGESLVLLIDKAGLKYKDINDFW